MRMSVRIVHDNRIRRGSVSHWLDSSSIPASFPSGVNPENRNAEYDRADDRYVEFLLSEIIGL